MEKYQLPSVLLKSVEEVSQLPGVGKKSALRYLLYLLKLSKERQQEFVEALSQLFEDIDYCQECFLLTESSVCHICSDNLRDHSVICVVENVKDVMNIESTGAYQGVFHVLGGLISPIEGISPGDLSIGYLQNRIEKKIAEGELKEVIIALSTTTDGETTAYYLYRLLSKYQGLKITTIARGIGVGDEIEYADEITLARSLIGRILFENTFV